DKGREATLGSAQKHAKYGMFTTIGSGAAGAILLVVGLVFAPKETSTPPPVASVETPAMSATSAAAPTQAPLTTAAATGTGTVHGVTAKPGIGTNRPSVAPVKK